MKRLLKRLAKIASFNKEIGKPLIEITLSKKALLNNLRAFQKLNNTKEIAPVLKSNAYGHGIIQIADILEEEKLPFYIIDSYFEAKELRNNYIKTPLLIIGYVRIENINTSKLKDIIYTISSIELLMLINSETRIHLKIDTGMKRQGVTLAEKELAIGIIKRNKNIILEGICSHLSDADNKEASFTEEQISIWNNLVKEFREEFPNIKYWHISATVGQVFTNIDSNINRLGIGLYGLINMKNMDLKPVLEMKTIITDIKNIKVGDSIGYNRTFIANQKMRIAITPIGYYEGIDRRLSNRGYMKVENRYCPILGRVSMNITVINIDGLSDTKIGDEVIVFSSDKDDRNSIRNIANICNTITYEIVVHIPQHLKRTVIQ